MQRLSALFGAVAFLVISSTLPVARADEDFKGSPSSTEVTISGGVGLGIVDNTGGFAFIGSAAKKIVHKGFVPDINNQVFIELQLGPQFQNGTDAFVYSTHLRWDFEKDAVWTFFAIGGLGGNVVDQPLGSRWELFPRFGAGAFWRPAFLPSNLSIRAEISHELTLAGISLAL